jgi:uncharacterized membrane protein
MTPSCSSWVGSSGYSTFVVVDQRTDPIEALRKSSRLTDGVKGQLFWFGLLLIGVNLVGALALGVGLLVTIPTSFIAAAYVFRRLQQRADVLQRGAETARPVTSPAVPASSH